MQYMIALVETQLPLYSCREGGQKLVVSWLIYQPEKNVSSWYQAQKPRILMNIRPFLKTPFPQSQSLNVMPGNCLVDPCTRGSLLNSKIEELKDITNHLECNWLHQHLSLAVVLNGVVSQVYMHSERRAVPGVHAL